jgi:adenosylcobinamide-phosphate synthase
MDFFPSWYVLPIAFILDLIMGDPLFLPHPVRWMGWVIETLEPEFRKLPLKATSAGFLFTASLMAGTWCMTFAVIGIAGRIHPILGSFFEILIVYYCISVRCLEKYAMDVYRPLAQKRIEEAKKSLSRIVGRDVENLSEKGIVQASVETVAENFVDGIASPLFYAVIGGAPLALAFKMASTLDSMVGYKNEKYEFFGKASARLDDVANFIPARLSIPIISLAAQILNKKGSKAFKTAIKEGAKHSSPNAGYPEAAFAGALGIKLGGSHYYQGRLVPKPHIGDGLRDVSLIHIKQACDLMMLSSFSLICILCGIAAFWQCC